MRYQCKLSCTLSICFVFSAICTGSTHDSPAFSVSGLKRLNDLGILGGFYYIIGYETYSCTEHMITPFSISDADSDQDNFNFYLPFECP